jgi:hypothetical protein
MNLTGARRRGDYTTPTTTTTTTTTTNSMSENRPLLVHEGKKLFDKMHVIL